MFAQQNVRFCFANFRNFICASVAMIWVASISSRNGVRSHLQVVMIQFLKQNNADTHQLHILSSFASFDNYQVPHPRQHWNKDHLRMPHRPRIIPVWVAICPQKHLEQTRRTPGYMSGLRPHVTPGLVSRKCSVGKSSRLMPQILLP